MRYCCTSCGKTIHYDEMIYRCPDCASSSGKGFQKGNLLIDQLPEKLGAYRKGEGIDPFELFSFPMEPTKAFSVGNTPLVSLSRLEKKFGFASLWGKMENANPSGSLKDRASLLVAAQAYFFNEKKVVLASTGNAGAAMSCAGAALGLDIILFVPETAPIEKLTQSLIYGTQVIPIKGNYDEAFKLSIEYTETFGGINRNTGYNPATTEGKKSAAIEIYNQLGGEIPDIVYIPAGDGVIYTGVVKGFEDLMRLGLCDHLPVCIAVQAEKSNAIARSFREKKEVILNSTDTIADSIAVCSPACGEPALHYLEKTQGWCVEVCDCEIEAAMAELAAMGGAFVEPSSASAWAGAKKDQEMGKITGKERIVLLLTGIGFKDMKSARSLVRLPKAIEPELDAILPLIQENH